MKFRRRWLQVVMCVCSLWIHTGMGQYRRNGLNIGTSIPGYLRTNSGLLEWQIEKLVRWLSGARHLPPLNRVQFLTPHSRRTEPSLSACPLSVSLCLSLSVCPPSLPPIYSLILSLPPSPFHSYNINVCLFLRKKGVSRCRWLDGGLREKKMKVEVRGQNKCSVIGGKLATPSWHSIRGVTRGSAEGVRHRLEVARSFVLWHILPVFQVWL